MIDRMLALNTSQDAVQRVSLLRRFAYLPIWIAPFLLLAPAWAVGNAIYWGTPLLQFVPWNLAGWDALRAGHLPLWNPYVGMGAPLLANYQSAFLYPPNWLYFGLAALGGAPWMAWGQAVLVALHLGWAGLGMALLIRRLGGQTLGQVIGGLAFGLSGYLVSRSWFLSINSAVAWVPWVILGVTALIEAQRTRQGKGSLLAGVPWMRIAVLGVSSGMQLLAGHAQTAWYTWLLALAWAAFLGGDGRRPGLVVEGDERHSTGWRQSGQRIASAWVLTGLGLGLGVLLALGQLLPTGEYLLQSQRAAAVDYEVAVNYSFWPWHFLNLVSPGMFGSPAQGDYWGYGAYWEDAFYLGLLPALAAMGLLWRSRGRVRRFFLALFIFTFLMALGKFTPVFPWLYHHIPTFAMFQAPSRTLIWVVFALALLAGLGVDRWRRPAGRAQYWTRLAVAAAFAMTIGAGLAWFLMGDISPSFIRATALAGFWSMLAAVLSLAAPIDPQLPGQKHTGLWSGFVIMVVTADLLIANWGLIPATSRSLYEGLTPAAEPVRSLLAGGRLYLPDEAERELRGERFVRFDTFGPAEDWRIVRAVALPNAGVLDRISSANNFDPLVPGRYARWMKALEDLDLPLREKWLNLMGVTVVENVMDTPETDRDSDYSAFGVEFDAIDPAGRVRWLPCHTPAAGESQAWDLMMRGGIQLDQQVIIETGRTMDCDPTAWGSAEIVTSSGFNPNRVVVRTRSEAAGWLFLSDVWYPGWQALVDGQPVRVERADYLFRAVPVEAGTHEVVFQYRPLSFYVGVGISSLAWFLIAVAAWIKMKH